MCNEILCTARGLPAVGYIYQCYIESRISAAVARESQNVLDTQIMNYYTSWALLSMLPIDEYLVPVSVNRIRIG